MASPTTRQTLIDFCLRRLGEPVIEINVDEDQVEDKVDDALQKYQEFHSDATLRTYLKHQITATDMSNGWIPLPSSVQWVKRLFPINTTFGSGGGDMFNIKYQMMFNNMGDFLSFAGDLSYIYQMEQYMSLIDSQLSGLPQVRHARRQERLYIDGDLTDGDILEGDFVVAEVYQIIDPNVYNTIWNDMFIKDYTTQLIKQQWGINMSKFEGMQLPGGVTVSGRQMYEDATAELERLEEKLRLEQELPVDFFIG